MSKVLVGQLEEKKLGAPGSWVAGKGSARWLSGYVVGGWVAGWVGDSRAYQGVAMHWRLERAR